MNSSSALLIGHTDRQEFMEAFQNFQQLQWKIQTNLTLPANFQHDVNLLILFQSYPGQFTNSELNRFRKSCPLSPIFLISGTCTEGSQRTFSSPLNGLFQIYAYQFDSFILTELEQFLKKQPSFFSVPSTADQEDIILQRTGRIHPNASLLSGKPCYIIKYDGPFGNDPSMTSFLADYCRHSGDFVCSSPQKIDKYFDGYILADSDASPTEEIVEAIQRLRQQYADARINVYIDSPRINEKMTFLNAGADCILPKLTNW